MRAIILFLSFDIDALASFITSLDVEKNEASKWPEDSSQIALVASGLAPDFRTLTKLQTRRLYSFSFPLRAALPLLITPVLLDPSSYSMERTSVIGSTE